MSAGTARRSIRVDEDLWRQFLAAVVTRDEDASTALRRYMEHYIKTAKTRQQLEAS